MYTVACPKVEEPVTDVVASPVMYNTPPLTALQRQTWQVSSFNQHLVLDLSNTDEGKMERRCMALN